MRVLKIIGLMVVIFFIGIFAGRYSMMIFTPNSPNAQPEHGVDYLNMIAHYKTLTAISKDINSGNSPSAKCIADVTASAYFRELRSCMEVSDCKYSIAEEVARTAPELISGDKAAFKYYENAESCSP